MQIEDEDMVHRCLDGDSEAFGTLVDKYKESVYASVCSRTQDSQHAGDITQEIFIKAYKKLHILKRADSFASWLNSIIADVCRDWGD